MSLVAEIWADLLETWLRDHAGVENVERAGREPVLVVELRAGSPTLYIDISTDDE